MKNRAFLERLGFAWTGIITAWKTERSFRAQVLVALGLIPVMIILRPAFIWWALVIVTAALVIAAELINTALEHLADHLHPELHPRIKIVKDCAAAAVLVLSLAAVAVALFMLGSVIH